MVFQKVFLPLTMIVLAVFAMDNMESLKQNISPAPRIGDIVRLKNLTSAQGKLLNNEVGEITSTEPNGRWGVKLTEEDSRSFNEINLEKLQNTVEDVLQHQELSKPRLLNKFNQINPSSSIRISDPPTDCRMTAFHIIDYFLGKTKSEECIENYFKIEESKKHWIDQTKVEDSLKSELLKIETKTGRKLFVVQFFPRIKELGANVEIRQRVVANKWCWGQNLSGIVHMIVVEKVTENAGVESQFRIFQSWASGYGLELWLNKHGICEDSFNQEFFLKSREKFGQGKSLSQSEMTKFIDNVTFFNEYNRLLKDETTCLRHLNYLEDLVDDTSLFNVLQQPEDLIDYYVKNNPDQKSAEILKKAAEGQRECMSWYFPDLIWYPETFLVYQVYE